MLKKIALAGIFALVSVISFTASTSNAARPSTSPSSVGAPVMKGFCAAMGRC
jgi:hypothetical protein